MIANRRVTGALLVLACCVLIVLARPLLDGKDGSQSLDLASPRDSEATPLDGGTPGLSVQAAPPASEEPAAPKAKRYDERRPPRGLFVNLYGSDMRRLWPGGLRAWHESDYEESLRLLRASLESSSAGTQREATALLYLSAMIRKGPAKDACLAVADYLASATQHTGHSSTSTNLSQRSIFRRRFRTSAEGTWHGNDSFTSYYVRAHRALEGRAGAKLHGSTLAEERDFRERFDACVSRALGERTTDAEKAVIVAAREFVHINTELRSLRDPRGTVEAERVQAFLERCRKSSDTRVHQSAYRSLGRSVPLGL